MEQLLEKNNIPVLEGTENKDGSSGFDNKEKCHALVASSSDPLTFIIDLGASRNMASRREFFISMYSNSGPIVWMGDGPNIQAKGVGRINLDNGYFNNVLYVLELIDNMLSVYQMTHTEKQRY